MRRGGLWVTEASVWFRAELFWILSLCVERFHRFFYVYGLDRARCTMGVQQLWWANNLIQIIWIWMINPICNYHLNFINPSIKENKEQMVRKTEQSRSKSHQSESRAGGKAPPTSNRWSFLINVLMIEGFLPNRSRSHGNMSSSSDSEHVCSERCRRRKQR